MPREYVRDRGGKIVGVLEDNGISRRIEIRDAAGRRLGTYDKRLNETRDTAGRFLAHGNVLLSLVYRF